MNKVIAVEDGLTPVKEFLREKGYQVVSLQAGEKADVAVISGGEENMMGIQNIVQDGPVIDARGMRPEEVWQAIESKWIH
ncbi:MAG: YkuS family protein [Firmicutes bacterium]|nr:YkuS family protein [Bacillota bacterium]